MRRYIIFLLFLPHLCYSQHWIDSVTVDHFSVQKEGSWVHMSGGGSYPETWKPGPHSMTYRTICYQLEVFTEKSDHHGAYIVNINGVDIDTINVKKATPEKDLRTWVAIWPTQENRTINLRPYGGTFVIDKIVRWVSGNPDYIPPGTEPCDSIYIPKIDTVFLTPKYYFLPDTLEIITQ